jgi:hypothetical protein
METTMTCPNHESNSEELTDLEELLVDIIIEAHTKHFSVSSDFARKHAEAVGMAASLGFITTKIFRDIFGRDWLPTSDGLKFLSEIELDEEESE